MSKKVVTFGEIMLRLSPPGFLRLGQTRSFDVTYGGGEANVAASLASYGLPADFVTRLPKNDMGDACIRSLRDHGSESTRSSGEAIGSESISLKWGLLRVARKCCTIVPPLPSPLFSQADRLEISLLGGLLVSLYWHHAGHIRRSLCGMRGGYWDC